MCVVCGWCSYIIERKNLGRGAIDQWVEIERGVSETRRRLTGYEPQVDCLYRIRAANEFGVSDPTMPASYYGKPSTLYSPQLYFLYGGVAVGDGSTKLRKNYLRVTCKNVKKFMQ